MEFLKKTNKLFGVLACITTIITNFVVLCIGTRILRVDFYYVTQALIPCIISRLLLIVWCLYFAMGYEYDRSARTFSKYLIPYIFISIIVLLIDKEMAYYFLFHSTITLLVLILMSNLINQKRFALRAKNYADKLYQLDALIRICIAFTVVLVGLSIPIAIRVQSTVYNVTLLISAMVSQVFVIVGIYCVESAEKKFQQSLIEGENPKQGDESKENSDADNNAEK
ncbi:MAG: hypothetical protein IKZ35_05140 [Clostridia bacterium]|nr:hypothetical protein [Clostridia bacterium]